MLKFNIGWVIRLYEGRSPPLLTTSSFRGLSHRVCFVLQCVLSSWARVFLRSTTSADWWTLSTGSPSLTCGSWEDATPTGATPRSSTTRPSVRRQPKSRLRFIVFTSICCLFDHNCIHIKKIMMSKNRGGLQFLWFLCMQKPFVCRFTLFFTYCDGGSILDFRVQGSSWVHLHLYLDKPSGTSPDCEVLCQTLSSLPSILQCCRY